jgi:hypothetical protein
MKKFKLSMSILAMFALLFTSCSKDEEASPDNANLQSVEITFGAVLNDLQNRAQSVTKDHFGQIPDCSDATPDVARIGFSYGGNDYLIDVDILSDETGYFTAYSEDLIIPVPNNGSVQVSLDSFRVYDGDPDNGGNLIWIAPIESVEGEFDGYVDSALPFTFAVRDGTKPYIPVEVLCYDRRMVNEYGYPFFDLVPGKLYPVCFFANYCPGPQGRHYVGNYNIQIFYDDGEDRISLYNQPQTPVTGLDGGLYFADPLCLVIPESPFDNPDTDYIFYVVTPLDWPGNYGDIDNTPLPEVGLSWTDIEEKLNNDGETVEYFHLFIGCEPPTGDCPGVPTEGDRDGDCVPDDDDDCPDEPGSAGNFGCPDDECPGDDLDGDNVYGDCDDCPNEAGPADNNGCPVDECPGEDPDGDDVYGDCDRCPNDAGTEDNYGCPIDDCTSDTDGDGVVDCNDDCPDVKGDNDDGCPDDDNGGDICETAFMYGDTAINSFSNANRWGWAEFYGNGTDLGSYPIYAGAGKNDVSKGTLVGHAVISIVDGDVNLEITLESGVELEELHVNLSEDKPSGNVAKAPGKYNMNSMVEAGTLSYTFDNFDFAGGDFWIIVHTVACYDGDDD